MFDIIPFRKMIVELEQKAISTPKRTAVRVLGFLYLWRREMVKDHCIQRSASLTYTTILAVFPLMAVIALFVPAFFGGTQQMEQQVIERVETILLPNAETEISESIRGYFEIFRNNSRAVGIFGTVALILISLLLFTNVEKSFNEIWQARRHRSLVAVFSRFMTLLILVPLLIGASIILTAELTSRVEFVGRVLPLVVPSLISCLALTLAYYILPNTSVRFSFAVIGGVFSALLWEGAKIAFGYYLRNERIEVFYKSLGAIPIFLIWIYLTWLIVLLGCEMTYLLQNYRRLKLEAFRNREHTILDSKLIFLVFVVIAEHFRRGKGGIEFSQLLNRVTISSAEMEGVLVILQRAGLISETRNNRIIPSRPLDKVKPADVLRLGCRANTLYYGTDGKGKEILRALENLEIFLEKWEEEKSITDFLSTV